MHPDLLAPVVARVQAGRLAGAGPIGIEAGKVISKYKTARHFGVAITDTSLAVARKQDQIDTEAALDGFYVLRTPRGRQRAGCLWRGGRLQEPQIRRAGLPAHQIRRPGPCGRPSAGSRNASGPTC